jgi:lactate permease
MNWTQNYDPLGAWPLSTALAALPVVTLFFVLVVLKRKVWESAFAGFMMAVLIAMFVFDMPAPLVAWSAVHGAVFGLFRIAWIIIASIFLYHVAVETGQFQVMKDSIAALSSDRRLQAVLIAFCFGAFLEGTGGGGAPVAIAGAFLIGLGFPPFQAAVLCLLANTAPVAWGGVGNPIRVLAGVTGLPDMDLSAMAGRILPPFSFILPIWLVRTMTGWTGVFQVMPALLVAGGSFAGMQYFWSNHVEYSLVDVVAAIFSLLVTAAFLKFWKPKVVETTAPAYAQMAPGAATSGAALGNGGTTGPQKPASKSQSHHVDELALAGMATGGAVSATPKQHSTMAIIKGWSPFIFASVFIFCFGYPAINNYLKIPGLTFPLEGLHNLVLKAAPVTPVPTPESAIMDLQVIALPGTAVFLGAFIAAPILGLPFARLFQLLGQTFRQLIPSLLAISFMVGLAYVTKYAGMDAVLGLSLTRTGWLYPFFGTLLGWLGVALTGTDAGSNALFGNLQKVTAEQLGLNPILMASANTTGGVMGKMIDAQSIVVASVATHQEGNAAAIFKAVFWHSIALASLVGLLVMLYAYVFPGVVPAV